MSFLIFEFKLNINSFIIKKVFKDYIITSDNILKIKNLLKEKSN
jgi:hypothetical protein